ncbi:hypothetical protein GGX14DRAFT_376960 [Mycena pura]|uniref:Uncharacterized protein n=1 Tax=Mycena pura TaxID=153505 RepID=A0AAD6V283_9AGAR|nr:hypothetical protein GGX14DRAFT_376960 [Mycena pura]
MALNLNYAANTYLAITLPADSTYLQAPADLALLHPAAAYVGQVAAMSDVLLIAIPKAQWEASESTRAEIIDAFKAAGNVHIQEPKQRVKREGLDDEL